MRKYDYIATIDCESEFIRSFDPGKLMHDIWESESFLTANKCSAERPKFFARTSSTLLGLNGENSRVRQETEDYLYCWWFSEIPTYRTDTLSDFFSWLNENSRREAIFKNWECFDYLVYVMWLIEYRNFKLKKLDIIFPGNINESMWHCNEHEYEGFVRSHGLHWTSREKVEPEDNNVVMKFHLDRLEDYRSPFWEVKYMYRKFKRAVKYVLRLLGLWRKN